MKEGYHGMAEEKTLKDVYPVPDFSREKAFINSMDQYKEMYKRSVEDPEGFWSEIAQRIHWFEPFGKVREYDFVNGQIKFFQGGKLNVSYNCLDRHLDGWRKNKACNEAH